ncbi:MAG: c-type cytochrome [Steroidobacteraceae bacterium]
MSILSERALARSLSVSAVLLVGMSGPAAAATADHAAVFSANCSMCHQLGATGVPGEFPRLAGRAGRIAATAAGRHYLERVMLFGMIGAITVDGTPIIGGDMPSFATLSNRKLAGALNYIVSLDVAGKLRWKGPVFTSADIAKARADKPLTPMQVHRLRTATLGKKRR